MRWFHRNRPHYRRGMCNGDALPLQLTLLFMVLYWIFH